jgi:hypothetical protein
MRLSQGHLSVHPALGWTMLVLLAIGLVTAACAPVTPVAAPEASPAATAPPSTTAADTTLEVAAGIMRAEEFLDSAHSGGLFNGVALIAKDGKIV